MDRKLLFQSDSNKIEYVRDYLYLALSEAICERSGTQLRVLLDPIFAKYGGTLDKFLKDEWWPSLDCLPEIAVALDISFDLVIKKPVWRD